MPADFLHEYDHLTLVRLVLAEQRAAEGRPGTAALDRALELLDRLGEAARVAGRAGSLVEIHLLRALTLDAAGRRSAALAALVDALTATAEPEGCTRLFLDEGAAVTELLRAVQGDRAVAPHARHLLLAATGHGGDPTAVPRPGIRPLPEPLSQRELQVLRLLDGELSGPDIARALFISPNTLRTHTKHVFTKLGVTSRREAVARARQRGLLEPPAGSASHPAGHIIR